MTSVLIPHINSVLLFNFLLLECDIKIPVSQALYLHLFYFQFIYMRMARKQLKLKDFTVELNEKIGKGGQSSVYEAYKGSTKYAAKCLQNKTLRQLLDNELLIYQKSKSHKNVIMIVDCCEWEEGNSSWIFMEYCKYGSLNEYCRNFPDQFNDSNVKLDLMLQMSAGLKFLHELKLIHRDIKPSNLLLTEEDGQLVVKVADFGVSRDDLGTSTQTVVGTLQFCAPEFWPFDDDANKKKYNSKIDVFALGLTFMAMVQQNCGNQGLIPRVKGLSRSQQALAIGQLMYMRKEDEEPPLCVMAEQHDDDEFTRTIKNIINEATHVDPILRPSAEHVYQKLTALAVKQVIGLRERPFFSTNFKIQTMFRLGWMGALWPEGCSDFQICWS